MPSILTWRRASYRREKLSQSRSKFEKLKALYYISFETFVMLCAILYHVYNSKNVKNTHGSNTFGKVAGSKVAWVFLSLHVFKIRQMVQNCAKRHICKFWWKAFSFTRSFRKSVYFNLAEYSCQIFYFILEFLRQN